MAHLATLLSLLLVLVVRLSAGFNVDVVHPVIFQGPVTDPGGRGSRADTYFGFSVGLSVGGGSQAPALLVGAPRANSTLGLNPPQRVREPGALFQCPLRRDARCEEVLVDATGNERSPRSSYRYTDYKDGGWLGGALDVDSSAGGRMSVSAFRWVNSEYTTRKNKRLYLGNGACYLTGTPVRDGGFTKYVPLHSSGNQGFQKKPDPYVYFYSYGQAGAAVHIPDNGQELVFGAPGVFDWTGTLIRYREADTSDSGGSRSRRQIVEDLTDVNIPNPFITKKLHRYDYLGYAVSSGRFYSSDKATFYLAGAPRAADGKGEVSWGWDRTIDTTPFMPSWYR